MKRLIIFTFLSISTYNIFAQNDTIKLKKESRIHFGIYYSIGINQLAGLNASNGFKVESYPGIYENCGLFVEAKVYKKLFIELNSNFKLAREGRINLKKDAENIDILIKNGKELHFYGFIKYNFLKREKYSLMYKIGLGYGFGYSNFEINYDESPTSYVLRPDFQPTALYSYATGIEINIKTMKNIKLYNQFLYEIWVDNKSLNYKLFIYNYPNHIIIDNINYNTFTYSFGLKF